MKKALITGITGQDGSYLAELLIEKGYEVHGIVRRASSFNWWRIQHLHTEPHSPDNQVSLHYGDMTDTLCINRILNEIKPDEVYNLAAQSHVGISFENPEYTGETDAIGALRILDAIRTLELKDKTRFYQASTSEMFGKVAETPQRETTPFYPRSPYGAAKLYAHWVCVNYREAYGLMASSGILFNHESPRRGENFVTRKITLSLAGILGQTQDKLYMGNLNAARDWGYAKDYVEGMWMMLQCDQPDDYVLATGEQHSVREFIEEAFGLCGMEIHWEGEGVDEKGIDKSTGKTLVQVDPHYFRPSEVDSLLGDPAKAKEKLGWQSKTPFKELVRLMVSADIKNAGLNPADYIKS